MNEMLIEEPMRAATSGIAIVDPEGRILEVNQRFGWLTGIPEDSRGVRIFDLIGSPEQSGLKEGLRMLSRTSCPERLSMDLTCRGTRFRCQLYRLPSEEEERLMITLIEAEDTRKVETLQWASTQDALRSRFDHDVRSRLNVILGYCAMLIDDLSMQDHSDEAVEDLRCIVAAGNDLLALNRKNSDLQRLIQGKLELDIREIYPTDVLADVIKSIRSNFPEHTVVLDADDNSFETDPGLFGKLMDTVLFRLCQELSAESRIKVSGRRDEE
ncbi:MAG: hypothetical protein HUJ31_11625, partial [Pseudomonadales bacterium]|nr:hypothetical protein [Pseudomonadales bacterium]